MFPYNPFASARPIANSLNSAAAALDPSPTANAAASESVSISSISSIPTVEVGNLSALAGILSTKSNISTRDCTVLGYTVEILVAMIANRQLLRTETNDALSDAVTAIDVIFETLDKHVRA